MDTATSRSMTVLVGQRCVRERTTVLCAGAVCAEANGGVSRATVSPSPDTPPLFRPLPSFPKYPQHPNFVIPRAVAESISPGSHLSRSPHTPNFVIPLRSRGIHSPFPKYPQHSNFVIPRAVAESISPCQCFNQRSQRPLHATMDTATSRSMTVLVGQRCVRERTTVLCAATVCAKANGGVSRATVSPSPDMPPLFRPLPSFPKYPQHSNFVIPCAVAESISPAPPFPKYPQHSNFVIPRAVAESISPCQCFNQRSQRPLHATMDTATSRSMTVLVGQRCVRERTTVLCAATVCAKANGGVSRATVSPSPDTPPLFRPLPSFPKYPQHPNFVIPAQSRNPSPPANASTREVPAARQLRHSAVCAVAESTVLCAGAVCAEANGGVSRATVSPSPDTPPLFRPLPSFPKYPQHPNFVIPLRSRGIHFPLPMLQPEKPAPSARHHGYCDFAQYDGVGRATVCAGTDDGVVCGNGVCKGEWRC